MKGDPERDQHWNHVGGGKFLVRCIASNPMVGDRIVVYRPFDRGDDSFCYWRPLQEFREQFTKEK